jgi:hypothetical protein
MYLLAELKNQGFDMRQDVLNTVNSMERIILTQNYGLIYNEFVTKKINISEQDVKAAYERSDKHVKVEYLRFPDIDSLLSIVSTFKANAKIETKDDFNTLAAICKEYPQVKYDTTEFVWPYFGMENMAEKIYNLKKDEIIPPTETMNGLYVYCAKDVYYAEKMPYEKIQPKIRTILEENEKAALRNAFHDKVNSAVRSYVDEDVTYRFMKKYDIKLFNDLNESRRTENLNLRFNDMLKDTILVYSIDSVKSVLNVEDFLNHYSHSAMLPIFADHFDLSNYLYTYAQDEYLLQLADSLGIKKRSKFQLDKKNYKNKTILSFFEARDLMPNIQVSDDEIERYYKEHQSEYLSGDTAEISVYNFDTERNAYFGRMELMKDMKNVPQENKKTSQYIGLKQLDSNITLTRNDGKYPEYIIRAVFKLKDDQYSLPIKLSNDFVIIKKIKETGSMVKPIEEVRDDIITNIKKIKCDKIKNEKILQAKKKYQIRVNKILLP